MKNYTSFEEIELQLKRLDLERKIALEEVKLHTTEIKQEFKPANLLNQVLKLGGKYGLYFLVKKFLK
ncbi:DUF6327 family protein [Bizionia sediminis]|uniref:DUF6327 family protein n=1 Tax=Bizionia sediminis TaxID=1737064 RepID=A0ABW5KQ48_9FLAO